MQFPLQNPQISQLNQQKSSHFPLQNSQFFQPNHKNQSIFQPKTMNLYNLIIKIKHFFIKTQKTDH